MLFDPYLRAPQTSRQEMAELAKAAEAKAEVGEAQVLRDLQQRGNAERNGFVNG